MIPFDGNLQRGESILQSIHTDFIWFCFYSDKIINRKFDEEYYEDLNV